MEENLIDRIGDEYLNPNFQDGQILLNTDINEIVSVVKEGINANFNDIQKIQNGSLQVGNSSQLDGATLTKFSDGELEGADNKIPTAQLVKSYVDNKVQEVKDTTEVGQLVENLNKLGIEVGNKVDKEDLVSEETAGTDKAYNCDYINELFESGVGDSLPIGTIVEYDGNNIPDGFEEVVEPENATVYIGPTEPTDGQDIWVQKGKNLYNKEASVLGYLNEDGSIYLESTYRTSDFISVSPNTTYFKSVTESVRAKYYDKNKKPLSNVYNDLGGSGAFAFTTPSNAYYLRVSMLGDYSDTLQIELGNTPTDYEAYIDKKIYTKNNNGGYEEFFGEEHTNKPYVVNFSDYVSLDSGYTLNSGIAYKMGNFVYLYYEITGTINAGQTTVGDILKPLLIPGYGSGRTIVKAGESAITNVKPNASMAISNGDFRIHSETAGTMVSGTVVLLINE